MARILIRFLSSRRCVAITIYSLVVLGFLVISGLYQYFLTLPYPALYKHWGPTAPLTPLIQQLKDGATPDVAPVNAFLHQYLSVNKHKCTPKGTDTIRLVYVVKSAIKNFYRREVIRQSWGFEQRFSDVIIRTVFLLGINPDDNHLQVRVKKENKIHKDIIQADFVDNYYNNTIKTIMGLHWTFNYCAKAKYFLFVDDDYYVSTRNVLRFLRDPNNYPQYLETYIVNAVNEYQENLYAGYVFRDSHPHRWVFSKWYVSLKEYPYTQWPPYVTAGAYVLSRRSLETMYYASIYTYFFRFDDIFMGMCARKAGLRPFHHPAFHFDRPEYSVESFKYTVASHGFGDPDEMQRRWEEQRAVGSA